MNRDRFKDAPWMDNDIAVILGGAGGIGSWLTLFLTRIGYSVILYDHDSYEEHNLGGQFVRKTQVDTAKVNAMQDLMVEFSDSGKLSSYNKEYVEDSLRHYFMISAFDNMQARKVMFNNWLLVKNEHSHSLFMDGRLNMEQIQIFCVQNDDKQIETFQKEHLFDDSEVAEGECTMRQTSHVAAMIGGYMTSFFTNHIANINQKNKGRHVPFTFELFTPLNYHNDGNI